MEGTIPVYQNSATLYMCIGSRFFIVHGHAAGNENLECLPLTPVGTNDAGGRNPSDSNRFMGGAGDL